MQYDKKRLLKYWNCGDVESMYDKYLLNLEIELIKGRLQEGIKILDVGCGEGEGTQAYSKIKNVIVHGMDFSETRLNLAKKRVGDKSNVLFKQVDFTNNFEIDHDYDAIISQRFLINLTDWGLQKKVLERLSLHLKRNGKFILLEGYQQGTDELNAFRKLYNQVPIPVKWHNLFISDTQLTSFMTKLGFKIIEEDGLGEYFLLTRGVRPVFDQTLNWQTSFNEISSSLKIKSLLRLNYKFSRLKLWVFSRK